MSKQDLSDPITLRIPIEVLQQFEAIAELTERTRSWVIVRAMKTYLAGEGRDMLAIIEGKKQIVDGQSHDMDDVLAELDEIADGKAA